LGLGIVVGLCLGEGGGRMVRSGKNISE